MSYLMRIDPFRGLSRMHREMDRMMRGFLTPIELGEEPAGVRLPTVDIAETQEEVIVKAEVPGVSKEDLDIEVLPESLSLSAQTHLEKEEGEKGARYYCRERVWERFERTIPLPAEVKTEGVSAKLKDGVLEIHLPKAVPSRTNGPQRIQVD